jgi:hypothetical protein
MGLITGTPVLIYLNTYVRVYAISEYLILKANLNFWISATFKVVFEKSTN